MKLIEKKKEVYPVNELLLSYLKKYNRWCHLPIDYEDLLRYDSAVALYDKDGNDTLWTTVGFPPQDRAEVHQALLKIYALLKSEGDTSVVEHLIVDRIDLCMFGNTKPFRIRIINTLNENFDYFYVKRADASRLYGLELEDILSPNRISFLTDGPTLIEEHIYGIPGDLFIQRYMDKNLNEVRLAKEFVKFNERVFICLLGDMHASNFVVDITVDFEENMYRIRSIDFDQQCYEGKKRVYQPQYFKENNPIVQLGINHLTWESVHQYQSEERALLHRRAQTNHYQLNLLLNLMRKDHIAPDANVRQLGEQLTEHYGDDTFSQCQSMGDIVAVSLARLSLGAVKK